eukprot:snap_masked-scaffold_14-processed-gene-8.6-mRNA-1 protein AED:1.00 eAED:1.00 QI:0/0/0/0/1/1/2/0/196
MSFINETSCDSPFAGRLTQATRVFNAVYISLGAILISVSAFVWYQKRNHFILAERNHFFFFLQCILAYSFLCYSLIFALEEPSPITSCSATIFFRLSIHFIPMPSFTTVFSLIARSKYNTKLVEYFNSQKINYPPFISTSDAAQQTTSTEQFMEEELSSLKFLSSPKVCLHLDIFVTSHFSYRENHLQGLGHRGKM